MPIHQALWIAPAGGGGGGGSFVISFDEDALREQGGAAEPRGGVLDLPLVLDYYNGDAAYLRAGYQSLNISFTGPDPSSGPILAEGYGEPPAGGSLNTEYAYSRPSAIVEIEQAYFEMNITGGLHLTALSFRHWNLAGSNSFVRLYEGGTLRYDEPLPDRVDETFALYTVNFGDLSPAGPVDRVRFYANPNLLAIDSIAVTIA
jgi:hypothetical protein